MLMWIKNHFPVTDATPSGVYADWSWNNYIQKHVYNHWNNNKKNHTPLLRALALDVMKRVTTNTDRSLK